MVSKPSQLSTHQGSRKRATEEEERCVDGNTDRADVATGHGMLAPSGHWKNKAQVLPWSLWKELDF